MTKKIFSVFYFLLCTCFVFGNPVSWAGKEFGKEHSPLWLVRFLKKGDDKLLRKKFGIAKNDFVFVGQGKAETLNDARYLAEADLYKKILAKLKTDGETKNINATKIIGLERLYDYWEKDESGIYSDYVVYTISDKAWKKNLGSHD